MPAHRSLLLPADVREAGKLCRCKHKSQTHDRQAPLVVKEPGPGTPEYGYCPTCAQEMLDKAEERLAELRTELQ